MIANENMPSVLNEQQVMMLRLLKKPLPEEDFKQMQRLAVQLLARQLDESIDEWEEEKNISPENYDALLNNHFRKTAKSGE
jgi:heme oxygenase